MSLQTLQWRQLPIRNFTIASTPAGTGVTQILNAVFNLMTSSVYIDGSTRTQGSGSAWTPVKAYVTGSSVEALEFNPPTKTVMSQSVLLVGRNTLTPAGYPRSTNTVTVTTNEGAFTNGMLNLAVAKNGSANPNTSGKGTFSNWWSSTIYTNGNSTGYASFATGSFVNKIQIYESKEAIAFVFNNTAGTTFACVAGAVVDPEQNVTSTDAEVDGRLYGFFGSPRIATFSSLFLDSATPPDFLTHNTSAAQAKAVIFTPQSSTVITTTLNSTFGIGPTGTSTLNASTLTLSGKLVRIPISIKGFTSNQFLGRLRDITAIKNSISGLTIRDSSNVVVGYTLCYNNLATGHTIVFNY